MESIHEIFDRLNGATRVAGILGVKRSTASEMKRRQFIHPRYWAALLESEPAKKIGLTSDDLVRLHADGERVE